MGLIFEDGFPGSCSKEGKAGWPKILREAHASAARELLRLNVPRDKILFILDVTEDWLKSFESSPRNDRLPDPGES